MGFKENLKSELAYQNILVKELATMSGIGKATLNNYLSARGYMPSANAAVKIARALGVSVEYLVTGEENGSVKASMGPEIRSLVQNFKLLNEDDRKMITSIMQLFKNRRQRGK
ncbi:MAG: helix-turn-helix domain-containing protein [Treponema sp.]|jgi:transcriptional regulator with XRE-family HTH domain|nr:helix-turn-helix domain-containing protein [Treponema sp.]